MSLKELRACTVERISNELAWREIIQDYEWLGTMPSSPQASYALDRTGIIVGVVVMGQGGGTHHRNVCGKGNADRAIVVERGACVHYAHPHAASYLLSRACKLAHEEFGWDIFIGYSDPTAGEIGTIYQALNWHYLGQGAGRTSSKSYHYAAHNSVTGETVSERAVRNRRKKNPDFWQWENLRAHPDWEVIKLPDKGKYVHFEGDKRRKKALLAELKHPILPYPKRPSVQTTEVGADSTASKPSKRRSAMPRTAKKVAPGQQFDDKQITALITNAKAAYSDEVDRLFRRS